MRNEWLVPFTVFASLIIIVGVVFATSMGDVLLVSPFGFYVTRELQVDEAVGVESDHAQESLRELLVKARVFQEDLEQAERETPLILDQNDREFFPPPPTGRPLRLEIGDWRDVSPKGELVDDLRSHWVSLTPDGRLLGHIDTVVHEARAEATIAPALGLRIYLFRRGRLVARGMTNTAGDFEMEGLVTGAYSLVAIGEMGFMTYALNLLNPSLNPVSEGTLLIAHQAGGVGVELNPLAIAPGFNRLKELIASTTIKNNYTREIEYLEQADRYEWRERWFGIAELNERRPVAKPATSMRWHKVTLDDGGAFFGRLYGISEGGEWNGIRKGLEGRPKNVSEVTVYVIQDDEIKGTTTVNEEGVFRVRGIEAGYYGLVATGQHGFGAVGFEAVSSERVSHQNLAVRVSASAAKQEVETFAMAFIDPSDLARAFQADRASSAATGASIGAAAQPLFLWSRDGDLAPASPFSPFRN